MEPQEKQYPGPGRQLDKIIAGKMGLEVGTIYNGDYALVSQAGEFSHLRPYSVSLSSAWQLINRIIDKRPDIGFELTKFPYNQTWGAGFIGYPNCTAGSPSYAICLAFLSLPDEVVR
jgi:hypothetical protein